MRRFATLWVALTLLVPLVGACSEDDDPQQDLRYTISIVNQTPEDLDIWIDDDTSTEPFVLHGTVEAGTTRDLTNRTVGTTYDIRLTLVGNDPDATFVAERVFRSSSGDDEVWTVNP